MAQSLEEMAEELTCSICLSLFTAPVTISCGHNFCLHCLELTWQEEELDTYNCPQCRFTFPSKPELRKNTLLSNLVNLTKAAQGQEGSSDQEEEEEDGGKTDDELEPGGEEVGATVMCDSCRKSPADKTCLTCMAAFCSIHLLPHLESPAFTDHQLTLPLQDLQKRKCPQHNKLLDHYCWEHSQCICCYCALGHKSCQTYTLEEGKKKKEQHYTAVLRSLNQKVDKATSTMEEIQYDQRKVMEKTKQKKELLEAEFEEIKALIDEEWQKAMAKIEAEEKKVNQSFSYTQNVLSKKKREFEFVRGKVQSLLQEQDDLQFLRRATKLRDTTSKEPFKPHIGFDEKLLQNIYKKTSTLKETFKSVLNHPEATPEPKMPWKKAPEAEPAKPKRAPRPAPPPDSREQLLMCKLCGDISRMCGYCADTNSKYLPADAEKLLLDPNTAHKKILMSNGFTKMAISDTPQNYRDNPRRFVNCSQVLGSFGFSGGLHYWEVEKEGGNFSGFGVAYQSIPRRGNESRLGRNKVSWCLEWCNGKLQAWHDDKQTDLTTPNTSKFGVLLNYNEDYLAFYCLGKKTSVIYKFRATFTEAVFPAFWMFSSNTVLTLSQSYTMEPWVTSDASFPTSASLAMASAEPEEKLVCPNCQGAATDPGKAKCEHNFCWVCIDCVLEKGPGSHRSSECRGEFHEHVAVQRSISLASRLENLYSHTDKTILCTYCVGSPVPAVKSCLMCEASLCDIHLQVHSKSPEHVLLEPTTALANRKCSTHKKILEYYCTEDGACICVSCLLFGGHQGHKVETFDTVSDKKKERLTLLLKQLTSKREETEKRAKSGHDRKKTAQEKAAGVTDKVSALFRDIRRQLDTLEKKVMAEIARQEEQVLLSVSGLVQQLDIKMEELSRKIEHLEELCNMSDAFMVIQEQESESDDFGDIDAGENGSRERYYKQICKRGLDEGLVSVTLHTGLSGIVTSVRKRINLQGAADILLDAKTAGNDVHISGDLKTATWSHINLDRTELPGRFQYDQVLSTRSFSSGRHYWEVETSESGVWFVGVGYPTMDRKGRRSWIGDNNKSWCLRRYDNVQYSVIHDGKWIQLAHTVTCTQLGVYLDYEAGQLSFYELCEPIRHLHTFTATFIEPLHAAFSVYKSWVRIKS
ncbi:E3 ubiquitin/ISG15 ligase TRIM25 [Gastrophryne carolinensis]